MSLAKSPWSPVVLPRILSVSLVLVGCTGDSAADGSTDIGSADVGSAENDSSDGSGNGGTADDDSAGDDSAGGTETDSGTLPPGGLGEFIEGLEPGTWGEYGQPWSEIDPGRDANCGRDFAKVLGAWNGVAWDGRYIWQWAGGGHADGCNNGLMRYDMETGTPQWVVPHLPLNVPYCRVYTSESPHDCWAEPYVSETPWPDGMEITKEQILSAWESGNPTPAGADFRTVAEDFGTFLRPRSSHMYNNMVRIGDWIYLITGQIWGSGKGDAQVWRFDATATDVAATIQRVADNWDPNARGGQGDMISGINANWTSPPGRMPFIVAGGGRCTSVDLVEGTWDCENYDGMSTNGTSHSVWDVGRNGVWLLRPNVNELAFYAEDDNGQLMHDTALSVAALDQKASVPLHAGGICLVPTDQGANPLIWADSGKLVRWDGTTLSEIDVVDGPVSTQQRIYNKWIWNDTYRVCMGTWSTAQGLWIYKPAF